jgi:hypothetical protein
MSKRPFQILVVSIGFLLVIVLHSPTLAYYDLIFDNEAYKNQIFGNQLDQSKFDAIGQQMLDDSAAEITQLQQQLESSGLGGALSDIQAMQSAIALTNTPLYPAPNELVTFALDDYSINATGATINWSVDGVAMPAWQNQRKVESVAPALGVRKTVSVSLRLPNGVVTNASITIQPVRIDIVVEGQTSVPAQYRGRPMPIQRTPIRATAVVFDGLSTSATDLSYRWSVNSTVVSGGAVRGGSSYRFTPPLRRSTPITVEVFNRNGTQIGRATVETPLLEPEILFYEVNPLRGTSYRALPSDTTFSGSELAVKAAPYYFSNSVSQTDLLYTWKLNNNIVPTNQANPGELIIQAQGASGSGVVELNVRNPEEIIQRVTSKFRISY